MSGPTRGLFPTRRSGTGRTAVALAVTALAAAVLGGCAVAEDVTQRAGDAAKAEASRAVADAVQDQICGAVGDGVLSQTDLALLRGLLGRATDSGVPSDVLGPLRDIAQDGKKATDAVDDLQRECAARQ
jgi:hypothetical protein